MEVKEFLKDNFFLFQGLNEIEIHRLLSYDGIDNKHFSSGEIMQNNRTVSKIGIIIEGKAVIRSGNDGVIIRKLSKNDIFGVACLFDTPTHLTSVIAVTDCTVITLSKSFVEACIKENSRVSLNYIEFLSKRVSFLNKKINAYTAKSAENKLYTYLLQLPRTENEIILPVDMSTVAKMIGIGRATLYRAFDKLEQSGAIIKKDKKIFLNEV